VKKIGLFFREETATFKRSAFGRFRKNEPIFSLGDAAGEFSLWFVSLFFVKKRNEQSTAGGAFHPAIFHPLPISHPGPISHPDDFPSG
jgi:hypothetical protein